MHRVMYMDLALTLQNDGAAGPLAYDDNVLQQTGAMLQEGRQVRASHACAASRYMRCQPDAVLPMQLPHLCNALPGLCHALHDLKRTQPASPGVASHKTEEGDGCAPQQLRFPAELGHVVTFAVDGKLFIGHPGMLGAGL